MMELTLEESLNMFMAEIAKRLDENTNLIKEIQAFMDFALRNQKAWIKALEIQVRQMSIILHKNLSGYLQSSTIIKPRINDETISTFVKADKPSIRRIDASQYAGIDGENDLDTHYTNAKPIGKALPRKEKDPGRDLIPTKLIVELADRTVKRPKGIVENVLVGIDKFTFSADFIILDIPKDFKTPLILGRPFLSTAHAIKNVVIKNTELGLETRRMGDELRKNKSQDPNFKDFIELNDPNEPIEHRRNQVKVFVPTIDEGEGMDEPIIEDIETKFDNKDKCEYLGFYNFCHP
ncbi:reverse transcriptase domain-containing protein [Tanacetum coccineum]